MTSQPAHRTSNRQAFTTPEWLITIGSTFFIFVLAVSAVFVPEIRWLHVVQAAMYVVAIFLAIRRLRWGYFIGGSVALFWSVAAAFGSPLFAEIIAEPTRPEFLLQGLGWLANVAVVVGSVAGYLRLPNRPVSDAGRLAFAFLTTTAFLLAATAMLAPSYLSHISGLLHPHWPWHRS